MSTAPLTDAVEDGPAISPLRPGLDPASIAVAGQWTLIWRKFVRNKVALASGVVILLLYLVDVFAEFLAPGLPDYARPQYTYAPAQRIAFLAPGQDGGTRFLPHVKGYSIEVDPRNDPAAAFGLGARPRCIAEGVLAALMSTSVEFR